MNEMNLFEPILDRNETIIKVFKPNKTKLFLSSFLIAFFSLIWVIVPALISLLVESTLPILASLGIVLGATLLVFLLVYAFTKLYYNKLYYAYSNKRIIIRTGVFGVDYKSLDMSMIGAVNVSVTLLDKLLKKNTGSILFGSMASPVMAANGSASAYRFSNIIMPYETYKEIKNVIDDYKELKNK